MGKTQDKVIITCVSIPTNEVPLNFNLFRF